MLAGDIAAAVRLKDTTTGTPSPTTTIPCCSSRVTRARDRRRDRAEDEGRSGAPRRLSLQNPLPRTRRSAWRAIRDRPDADLRRGRAPSRDHRRSPARDSDDRRCSGRLGRHLALHLHPVRTGAEADPRDHENHSSDTDHPVAAPCGPRWRPRPRDCRDRCRALRRRTRRDFFRRRVFRRSLLCGGFFRERFGSERFLPRRFPGRCIASSGFFPGSRFFSRRSFPRRGLLSGSCLSGSRCGGPGCFGRGISERFHFRGCQVARGFHQQFGRVGHRCCRLSRRRGRGGRCLRRLVEKRVKHLLARRAQRAIVARGTAALAPDDSALGHGRRNSRNLRNRHDRRGFNRRWIHWRQVDGGELVRRRLGGRRQQREPPEPRAHAVPRVKACGRSIRRNAPA